ncbi:M3 family oligoendopeptidase [Candidatus Woesearchaeota archaeon]|nr:M3 family oligoendopeptidase [Candidatus Woesearchaeota archaeon]
MTYIPSSWNLADIAPKDIKQAFQHIEQHASQLEAQRPTLTNTIPADQFLTLITQFETLRQESSRLSSFAELQFAENSANADAAALRSRIEIFLTKISNRLLFFSLWFKKLPAAKAQELIHASGKYHYYLEEIRRYKPYTLKEDEEKIINIKDTTGVSALNTVYSIFTSQFEYDFEGKKLNQNELLVHVRDPSPQRREAAYRTLLTKYQQHQDVLGEIYKDIILDWGEENMGLRGYKNPIQVRHVHNDLPDKAVQTLLDVAQKNISLFQRFFELKRKKLNLPALRRFDLYAPLPQKPEQKIDYDAAIRRVLDAYQHFSPQFKAAAEQIIKAGHIHSLVQKNKNTGAFCCSVTAQIPPYVLLNYTGTLRDVSTLAHELGHGVHHVLAKEQTEFTFHSCLPLAETASIFGEMLLTEKLKTENPARVEELIFAKLEDIYASIIRQIWFVLFEQKAHQAIAEGKSIPELNKIYLEELRQQLGYSIEIDDLFAHEWCYIPHIFHTPFYCYAYAFGNLLVLALWEMYQEKGPSFAPKIIEMLAKGGSESPLEITRGAGVDITSAKFWQKGFDVIERMIKEIE